MTVTVSVPLIPNELAAGAQVGFTPGVAVNTSESGNANRKTNSPPKRVYTVAISPDHSSDIQEIIMALDVARYPVGIMDPINFKIEDHVAQIQPGGASAYIMRNWVPSTGVKTRDTRIVMPVEASLAVRVNDVAATSGSVSLGNYGEIFFSPALNPDTDEVRVDCQFYTPASITDTPVAQAFGVTPDGIVQYQFTDMKLMEMFAKEFEELTA
ncbi:DUF2460 domain-containing protein [Bradyrhizobium sp. Arg62]|uniref:hypothetical protein n=1 Tax=Bradyrhizobium brasilense TaxID=1419277 RepID=UPI001E49D8E9|nr:hypothetical protein [Bradyrhizobium brasilense]MCC8946016.1 DUF2460 domain-containing protein [Bradyrhizobium brasilense]